MHCSCMMRCLPLAHSHSCCCTPPQGTCGNCQPQTADDGSRTCMAASWTCLSVDSTSECSSDIPSAHLGMSMPAASQACSTEEPFAICTGSSFTNTSIVSADCGAACCRALAVVDTQRAPCRMSCCRDAACLTLLSIGACKPDITLQIRS